MHILVTNDDGPPSAESSPYILPFVEHLHAAGHVVSVVLPSEQRSWIAKAHIVGQDVVATPYKPPTYSPPSPLSQSSSPRPEWYLTTSPPASCTQLGLHHLFPASSPRGPIDLVVSGPNYGRNTTAVFALSSGTLGGALEAAVAGHKAVAVSFAFMDRSNPPATVAAACRHAVRVVEYLAGKEGGWDSPTEEGMMAPTGPDGGEKVANPAGVVCSVNVPLVADVESRPSRWTQMLLNRWRSSCFVEQGDVVSPGPAAAERAIRRRESAGAQDLDDEDRGAVKKTGAGDAVERHFKWSPKFTDVYDSVQRAGAGSDGWAVANGMTSVTILRANFMHVGGYRDEELRL